MKNLLITCCVLSLFLGGCVTSSSKYILVESEAYYLIPAGTSFNAIIQKGKPPVEVTRQKDTYAVDAETLIKLQEEANLQILDLIK